MSNATASASRPASTYTARQLLDGLLLVSGNDAANTLARLLGGPDVAVAKMNAKAAAAGRNGTHVGSPSGLDGPGMAMRTHSATTSRCCSGPR